MKKYYPILLAKEGEFIALTHLAQIVKNEICPIIEVIDETIFKKKKVGYNDKMEKFLLTHWAFENNQIILDFSYFDFTNDNLIIVQSLVKRLLNRNVNVILCVQNNSNIEYLKMVRLFVEKGNLKICIRISGTAGGGGFADCYKDVNSLINQLKIKPNKTILFIDLGYTDDTDIDKTFASAKLAILLLTKDKQKWLDIIIASGSFPVDLGDFKEPDQIYSINRYEWTIWKKIKNDSDFPDVKYGDFGTKYPIYVKANFQPTISVKYTVDGSFIICKGKKTDQHKDGHGQYISHCKKLVEREDFFGENFSWADNKIYELAYQKPEDNKLKTGNTTTWVSISQNHHITHMHEII